MIIKIKRFDKDIDTKSRIEEFSYVLKDKNRILDVLEFIKEEKDQSLSYRCGCGSGVCGSCAVKVNGVEKLACKTEVNDNDLIEPLNNSTVIKDLVIDLNYEHKVLKNSQSYLHTYEENVITSEDEKTIDRQSNCILCQSCYSSCPVFEVNKDFLGPFALTRALRYVNDKKEIESNLIIDAIQKDGVWDCTLCGNCTMVCPQFIDPKTDIMNLRMKSVQAGYKDPNMQDFSSINNEFNSGFDPSGGFGGNMDGGFNPNAF